ATNHQIPNHGCPWIQNLQEDATVMLGKEGTSREWFAKAGALQASRQLCTLSPRKASDMPIGGLLEIELHVPDKSALVVSAARSASGMAD
ncbi:hypothetical protein, partial [Bradyrhizobium sp. CCBAU 11361]|uniref:hypothetical protein n=1 Tax=Bradyrhizobium sp. CCBAU 11361 TaxID=1630812 RepID=UPI0023032357